MTAECPVGGANAWKQTSLLPRRTLVGDSAMRILSSTICPGTRRRLIPVWVIAASFFAGMVMAQSPVTVAIGRASSENPIPPDFIGLSFETEALQPGSGGGNGYMFDATNTELITLFQNLGIRSLRIGGTSVDHNQSGYIPAKNDIDALFGFAGSAQVKVIYSLRLLNGDPSQDASAAKYVLDDYAKWLTCFAIGNEPNLYKDRDAEITNGASLCNKWRALASIITKSVPDAKFGGPDTGTGGTSWASDFAEQEANSGIVTCIFSHYYIGGNSKGDAQELINKMLSPAWDAVRYPTYYDKIGATAGLLGIPYRLTELNSFVANYPGIWGGHNAYATALFALDCMHWWAAHHCEGVNFHTFMGKYNGTICRDAKGGYQVYPIAYGIKAFDIGGHGQVDAVSITNPDHLNLTAYAVTGSNQDLFVTVINKEHNAGARSATVTINPGDLSFGDVEAMFLVQANGDAGATNSMTLGGASIANNAPWSGKWTRLKPEKKGCVVMVPAVSAVILKISYR